MTSLINQFDIKYNMVKSIVGRNKINVIESVPYSELIFHIANGKNYALSIAEARGKEDSSPTAKQLKQLEDRGFIKSKKEPLLNKTIYSINWEKIQEEFINYVFNKFKSKYEEIIKIDKEEMKDTLTNLKKIYGNEAGEKRFDEYKKSMKGKTRHITYNEYYEKIKDKEFERKIKNNEYITYMLKITLSFTGSVILNKTLKETFEDLRSMLSSDKEVFDSIHHPSSIQTLIKNDIPLSEEDKKFQINEKDIEEYSKKIFEEKKEDKKYKDLEEFIQIAEGITDLNSIQGVYHLQGYLQIKYSLQGCPENNITKREIATDSDSEELKSVYEDNPNLRTLIDNLKTFDLKVAKSTENNQNKSGNTNQNNDLSNKNKGDNKSK